MFLKFGFCDYLCIIKNEQGCLLEAIKEAFFKKIKKLKKNLQISNKSKTFANVIRKGNCSEENDGFLKLLK